MKQPWWRGSNGEWYVVIQGVLFAVVALAPRTWPGWPAWAYPWDRLGMAGGGVLLALGLALSGAGVLFLGRNLTPLPRPKESATLVQTGVYGVVRHPIYSGLIFMAFGWALVVQGWLTLGYALALFIFFDVKSRREERWLMEKFPAYADYQRRVRKLIPWVY